MFSVSLELPEFEVVNQEILPTHYLVHVEKKDEEERCPHCGFLTSFVHDRRTRKIRVEQTIIFTGACKTLSLPKL